MFNTRPVLYEATLELDWVHTKLGRLFRFATANPRRCTRDPIIDVGCSPAVA